MCPSVCMCVLGPVRAQIFLCPVTQPEQIRALSMRIYGRVEGKREKNQATRIQTGRKKVKQDGVTTMAGRLHAVILALSNHKSFSEPLIHFTKQAVH